MNATNLLHTMKTRWILTVIILLVTLTHSFGQSFEGKLIFANTYRSKMPNVSDEQFNSMMGTMQEYYIKNGNYKSSMNGTFFQWQLYINKDNKLYSKMSNSPSVFWTDGEVNPDVVVKAEINKGVLEVLGYSCDELILTCKSGIQKYYFSNKLKVDAKQFEKHKFGNWSEVLSRTHALPLKMIIESPQFILDCVATKVESISVDSKMFELPADAKIEKSPY